ncbi:MAG: mannonate dehydratase [Bacteroidota bacterium]
MRLLKSWRWFGEKDSIKLSDLKQMGVEGVVTALHHIPNGEIWPVEEILKVKNQIEAHGMKWTVVESLPVSEGIKTHNDDYDRLINNYRKSIENLGKCGIDRICYNFMPVLDWVRTDLHYKLESGGEVMLFDFPTFIAFDVFVLQRTGAESDYPNDLVEKARVVFEHMTDAEKETLAHNTIVVTQGFIDGAVGDSPDYKNRFLELISRYDNIDADQLRKHLSYFLQDIVSVAEEYEVKMCIHPDDPPFPVLGLPRIVSTQSDLEWICHAVDSPSNGITFCTGSLSVNRANNLVEMVNKLADRIHFAHLRNNTFLENRSFHEKGHLYGDVDMIPIIQALLEEQMTRADNGRKDIQIPFRPDHGIKMLDDYNRQANPGYPLIGRLMGLAELDGIQATLEYHLNKTEVLGK